MSVLYVVKFQLTLSVTGVLYVVKSRALKTHLGVFYPIFYLFIHLNLCPTGQNQKRNSKNFQKWPRNNFFKNQS